MLAVELSGEVKAGTEDNGTTAKIELGTMLPVSEQLMVKMSVGSTWADATHMESYFGVSPAQSARSGYSRYEAESGFKSAGISVGVIYNISEEWNAMLMVNGDLLLGDAADSPITKEEFYQKAGNWNIPEQKIEHLWKKYVSENIDYIKEVFYKKAESKNIQNEKIGMLWQKYLSKLQ